MMANLLHYIYCAKNIIIHYRLFTVCRRYMANGSLFNSMTEVASTVPGTKLVIGGNAPVMVNRILQEGVRVLLGAQMSKSLRTQMGPNVVGEHCPLNV